MTRKKPSNRPDTSDALERAILAIGTSDFIACATDYLRASVWFKGVFASELRGRKQPATSTTMCNLTGAMTWWNLP